jgi:predicted small secreted protein
MKKLHKFAILVALLSSFGLSACNTIHGMGQDIQDGGQDIKKTSTDHGAAPTQ